MKTTFYRALDRPMAIIGLKGAWIKRFLIILGILVLVAVFTGFATGAGTGISVAILGAIGDYFYCLVTMQKVSQRRLGKQPLKSRMHLVVRRHELLSRILLEDNGTTARLEARFTDRNR